MENVLVTGGCGFIGSRIVNKLIRLNYHVHIIDNLSTGNMENIDLDKVTLHVKDINDNLEGIFRNYHFKYIFHQAAQTSVPYSVDNLCEDTKINVLGSVNLIDLAQKYNAKRFIFASSAAVYGNPKKLPVHEDTVTEPTSPYGLSKLTIERYLELAFNLYGLNYTILRYSNVYGPKQNSLGEGGVVSIFNHKLKANERPCIYGDGLQTRDFIYVDDVAEANIAAIYSKTNGVYNISCNNKTTIIDLFNSMKDIYNKNIEPIYGPPREGDIKNSILSNKKAKEDLEWTPRIPLEEGLKETIHSTI